MEKLNYPLLFTTMAFVSVVTFAACKSKKYTTPAEAEGKRIKFSYGGGFTGQYTTYVLLENGQVFKSVGITEDFTELPQIDYKIVTQIFANYHTLNLEKKEVTSYGNMNYSIEMKVGKETQKLIWEKNQPETEILQMFYDISIKRIDTTEKPVNRNFEIE